jgi:Zn-dependent metalloprotease
MEQHMAARKEYTEAMVPNYTTRRRDPHPHQAQQQQQHGQQSQGSQQSQANQQPRSNQQSIITPNVLGGLANSSRVAEHVRTGTQRDLEHRNAAIDQPRHQAMLAAAAPDDQDAAQTGKRSVYTVYNSQNMRDLPGEIVRREGEGPVQDKAVNEVYDNIGSVLEVYKKFFD